MYTGIMCKIALFGEGQARTLTSNSSSNSSSSNRSKQQFGVLRLTEARSTATATFQIAGLPRSKNLFREKTKKNMRIYYMQYWIQS